MPRAVLLGATGYTGRLTAAALARRGVVPLLAGRSETALKEVRAELGGSLETAVADVRRPESIAAVLEPGDLLVTTVGPFLRLGRGAVEAALSKRAHYVDTTGEGAFVLSIFERNDAAAREAEILMLPALGYDYVPGNLAGALALREAGAEASRIEIAYFFTGETRGGLSRGTIASAATIFAEPVFTHSDGRRKPERAGAHVRSFDLGDRRAPALTLGSSEELWLPRLFPDVRDARVFQGGLGPATRAAAAMGALTARPALTPVLGAISRRLASRRAHGPDPAQRERSGTLVVAEACSSDGRLLTRIALEGPNVYDATAGLVAWGADRILNGQTRGSGVMGPVEAFGLDELESGCRELGFTSAEGSARTAGR